MGFIGSVFVVIRDKYRYSAQRFAQLLLPIIYKFCTYNLYV